MDSLSAAASPPEAGITLPAREFRLLTAGIKDWSASAGGTAPGGSLGLLTGEPGAGKSLLLSALARQLESHAIRVFRATFYRGEAPLTPIRQLLRELIAGAITFPEGGPGPRSLTAGDLEAWLPELCRLLPELPWPHRADPFPTLGPALDRLRACDALAQVFLAAARASPLILALENLHWADPLSRSVLAAILRTARFGSGERPRILLLATLRPKERSGLEDLLDRRLLAFEVDVRGYSRNELRAYSQSLGKDLPLTTREALYRVTEGNPLHLQFLLQGTAEGVDLTPPRGGADSVPRSEALRQAVEERFRRLDEAHRAVLEVVAALGRPAGAAVLAALAQAGEAPPGECLARLQSAGWVRHDGGTGDERRWEVAGEPIAAAVLGLLAPAGREALEARVAEGLLALAQGSGAGAAVPSWSRVFHHLRQAGAHPRLVEVGREAALEADRLGADEQAIEVRERLFASLDRAADRKAFLEIGEGLAVLLDRQGHHQEAIDVYRALAAVPDLPPEILASYLRKMGALHRGLGEPAEAARSYAEGLTLISACGDCPERPLLHARVAQLAHQDGEEEDCLQALTDCLESLSRVTIGEADRLEVLRIAEEVSYRSEDYQQALALEEQIQARVSVLPDAGAALQSLEHLARLHFLRGDADRASEILGEALERARATGSRLLTARFLERRGDLFRASGDVGGALDHFTAAASLCRELGHREGEDDLYLTIAQLRLQAFEVKEAVPAILEYFRLLPLRGTREPERPVFSPEVPGPEDRDQAIQKLRAKIAEQGASRQGGLCAELADLLVGQGEHQEATRLYEQALRSSYASGSPLMVAQLFQRAARLWRLLGERSRALQFYQRSLDFLGPVPEKELVGNAYLEVASILLAQGEAGRAYDYLVRAFRIFQELRDDLGMVATVLHLSGFLQAAGLRSLALSLSRAAADLSLEVRVGCLEAEAHRLRGVQASEAQEFTESARSFARARQVLDSPRLFAELARLQLEVGWGSYRQGDYTAAETVAREGLELARKLGMQDLLEDFIFLMGSVESALSNRSKNLLRALELLNQALLGAQARRRPLLEVRVLEAISRLYREWGKEELSLEFDARSRAARDAFLASLPPPLAGAVREEHPAETVATA